MPLLQKVELIFQLIPPQLLFRLLEFKILLAMDRVDYLYVRINHGSLPNLNQGVSIGGGQYLFACIRLLFVQAQRRNHCLRLVDVILTSLDFEFIKWNTLQLQLLYELPIGPFSIYAVLGARSESERRLPRFIQRLVQHWQTRRILSRASLRESLACFSGPPGVRRVAPSERRGFLAQKWVLV